MRTVWSVGAMWFRRLLHFCLCAEALGLMNATKLMFIRPMYRGMMSLKLKGQRPFYFRGKEDGGFVLAHFCLPNYFIEATVTDPIKVIVDGGAYIGDETIRFSTLYPTAQVIAIEATMANYDILEMNFQGDNRVHLLYGALYPENVAVSVVQRTALSTFQVIPTDEPSEAIPTWDIPSILDKYDLDRIDILKLDIEGAEYELFSINVEKWIEKVNVIIFEVDHDRPIMTQQVFRAVTNIDFKPMAERN